jgi:hypothetical protein
MADTITYFGNPVRATYPNGDPVVVNGRPLLIPENFDLQREINAAHHAAAGSFLQLWFHLHQHYALGSSGDPQRQAGHSGGFDPRYTDAGNYAFALSAAAAGLSLEKALELAASLNKAGTGKALPAVNENAIRQGFADYAAQRFPSVDDSAGAAYARSVRGTDRLNALQTVAELFAAPPRIKESDVQRYAKAHWADLNSPDAQAFMTSFQQAFGGYPQHVDLNLLQPMPSDESVPSGKDVSLFVGRNGEVLMYPRDPAPGGTGALRGIYGLDGGPNGAGSTGLTFFQDGTPKPVSVRPHTVTSTDPAGGIDVTLPNGAREHWWSDPIDGFIRRQQDYAYLGGGYDTPSERLGHVPSGAADSSPDSSLARDGRSGSATAIPGADSTVSADQPAPAATNRPIRYLSGRFAGPSGASLFDNGAPAVPFVVDNNPLAPAGPFDGRFGNLSPPPAPSDSDQASPQPQSSRPAQPAPEDIRVLSSRFAWLNPGGGVPGNPPLPNGANPPAQAGWRPATTRPVPDPAPPIDYGLLDSTAAWGDNMDDWFSRWIKPLLQQ